MKWMFSEKITVNQQQLKAKNQPSCQEKCKIWDRQLSWWLFAALTLTVIMGIILYNIFSPSGGCGTSDLNDKRIQMQQNSQNCEINGDCSISCADCPVSTIGASINAILSKNSCRKLKKLRLSQVTFDEFKITKRWLSDIAYNVTELEISKCELQDIREAAFSDPPFERLSTLTIVDASLDILTRHSFLKMSPTLSTFAYRSSGTVRPLAIEKNVLDGISNIEVLQINNFDLSPDDVVNLLGTNAPLLTKLQLLDLSENSIQVLKETSLRNAPYLKKIHLKGTNLQRIHKQAFRKLREKLTLLDLESSGLESLQKGTFDSLQAKSGGIKLGNNNWKCDCSLQWLKEYMENKATGIYINSNNPPLCADGKTIQESDFCPESSTTTSWQTNPTTETTTDLSNSTEMAPTNTVTVDCNVPKKKSQDVPSHKTHQIQIKLNQTDINLDFHESSVEPLQVQIKTNQSLQGYRLIWLDADNKSDVSCSSLVEDGIIIENLKHATMYSFSLLYENDTTVSPTCSFCLKTSPHWGSRTWLTNDCKLWVIILLIILLLGFVLLTSIITFLCVRRHPEFISGNKNVIIIKKKKNIKEIATPKEEEKPAYGETYLAASSTYGYLTPKLCKSKKINASPVFKSISEWTTSTTQESIYADPHTLPTLKTNCKHNRTKAAEIYDCRSPRPPARPTENQYVITRDDCYTTVINYS